MKYVHTSTTGITISAVLLLTSQSLSSLAFSVPPPLVEFTLGAIAGGAGAFAAYPFDYIKSQMQTEVGKAKYKNGFECFMDTIQHEGPLQLYRGAAVTTIGNAPEKALKLHSHDIAKAMLLAHSGTGVGGTISLGNEILAGVIAGVCQVVLTSPLETVKVALQTSDLTMKEVMQEIGGLPGLFKGSEACIARDVVFNAILFPVYSHLRVDMPDYMAGSMAGVAATFTATPTDVVKTRILSQDACARLRRTRNDATTFTTTTTVAATPLVFASSFQPRLTTATAMAATKTDNAEGDVYSSKYDGVNDYLSDRNPFVVAYKLAEKEGRMVLFSGVLERCVGSIPRFGLTLSLHDALKTMALHHHWI